MSVRGYPASLNSKILQYGYKSKDEMETSVLFLEMDKEKCICSPEIVLNCRSDKIEKIFVLPYEPREWFREKKTPETLEQ